MSFSRLKQIKLKLTLKLLMMAFLQRFWYVECSLPVFLTFSILIFRFSIFKVQEGERVPVNTTIALLAEEGDDISNIEIPADEPKEAAPVQEKSEESSSTPAAAAPTPSEPIDHHDIDTSKLKKPLSPAVLSLLLKHGVKDVSSIKPTGPNGRLLKGDVLGHLGLINYKAPPPFAKTAAPPRDQIVFAKVK